MRNYDARLARIEKALLPKQPLEIRVVYLDTDLDGNPVQRQFNGVNSGIDYRRDLHRIAPIAVVAPGMLESIGTVEDMPAPVGDTGPTINVALPGDPPKEQPWSFERAMLTYREPYPGPNLARMRAMARKAQRERER